MVIFTRREYTPSQGIMRLKSKLQVDATFLRNDLLLCCKFPVDCLPACCCSLNWPFSTIPPLQEAITTSHTAQTVIMIAKSMNCIAISVGVKLIAKWILFVCVRTIFVLKGRKAECRKIPIQAKWRNLFLHC